jgi:beta-alanine--pyruvate transaminase
LHQHDILLIFDEVIHGFRSLTAPFAADYFDLEPDRDDDHKGLTNGMVPMVPCSEAIIFTMPSWMRHRASNCSTATPYSGRRWRAPLRWRPCRVFEEQDVRIPARLKRCEA